MKIPALDPILTQLAIILEKHQGHVQAKAKHEGAETELLAAIDAAERSGSVDDDQLVTKLANDRARLAMFPARLASIEGEIISENDALKHLLNEASRILGQHHADVCTQVRAKMHQEFSKFVGVENVRNEMIDLGIKHVALVREAFVSAANFTHQSIREAIDDRRLPEFAAKLVAHFASATTAAA